MLPIGGVPAASFEGGNDLAAEQLYRVAHEVRRHRTDLVVGAEDVVADPALALLELADDRVRAADQREPLFEIELVAVARTPHGRATRLVVGPLAVASHAARVRPPADAGLLERAATDRDRAALTRRQI